MKVEPLNGLVFTRNGQPITGNAVNKARGKACRDAGTADFRFHDLRHCGKNNRARAGIPVEVAMAAAGHSSIQMHQAYVHLQKTDVAKAFGTSKKFYNGLGAEERGGCGLKRKPFILQCVEYRGGVAERFKAPVLKTGVHCVDREFESRPLRQIRY